MPTPRKTTPKKAPLPYQRTVTITNATVSGTVGAGARRVSFHFGASYTGTVAGAPFAAGEAPLPLSAPQDDSLPSIAYTITAGSVRIVEVR